jgi:Flp pilus assembly protein TadG
MRRTLAARTPTTRQRGAALVEFAILAPLLIVLLMGIIEFGWIFGQFNQIRHAAQEGARWGAVSRPDVDASGTMDWADLVARSCGAADLPSGTTIDVSGLFTSTARGGTGSVTVTANIQSLTGVPLISDFLPGTLTNTATFRLEQAAPWATSTPTTTCP